MKTFKSILALFLAIGIVGMVSHDSLARLIGTNPTGSSADLWCNGGRTAGASVLAYTEVCQDYLGDLIPTSTSGTQSLGTAALPWLNTYTNGMINTGSEAITGNLIITGRVGVGDTTPDAQLEILSNSSPTGFALAVSSQSDVVGNILAVLGNGNVGVNTATPSTSMDVNGAINIGGTYVGSNLNIHSPGNSTAGGATTNDMIRFSVSGGGGKFATQHFTDELSYDNYFSVNKSSFAWAFGANAAALDILSSGNVGIGNTSPATLLHLSTGSLTIDGLPDATGIQLTATSTNRPLIRFSNATNGGQAQISGTGASLGLEIDTNGGTQAIVISSNGGVGFRSKSIAQLQATTPNQLGEMYYCNNCSPLKVVISTGLNAGNFADAVGSTFK